MVRAAPNRQVTRHKAALRVTAAPRTNGVAMSTSGFSTALGHFPSPPAAALARFHPEAGLGHHVPTYADRPLFEQRAEPVRPPAEVCFGPFRLLPSQFLLLEDGKPVSLGS